MTLSRQQDFPPPEGIHFFDTGNFEAALYFFLHRSKTSAGRYSKRNLKFIGLALLGLSRWEDAAENFTRARQFQPDDAGAWLGLGISLGFSGKTYLAVNVLEGLLEHHPDLVLGHIQIGLFYGDLNEPQKKLDHMKKALSLAPGPAHRDLMASAGASATVLSLFAQSICGAEKSTL